MQKKAYEDLVAEVQELRTQLDEAQETLNAIRRGEVDGLVVSTPKGEHVYTLTGAEKPYRALIEDMREGAVMLSDDNTILYCNSGFAKIMRRPMEKIVGTNIENMVCPTHIPALTKLLTLSRAHKGAITKEVTLQARDDILVPTLMSVNSVQSDTLNNTFLVVTDLSEHMEEEVKSYSQNLERIVEERTKQLKDAERLAAIGATAGMVGHDIRNPLQAITGDVYLTKSDVENLPESQTKKDILENLQSIEQNIFYINKIVVDLQDYAKSLNPHAQETNINTVVKDALIDNGGIPDNIKVELKIANNVEVVIADSDFLKRMVRNLVINAVQAMPNGGVISILANRDKETNDFVLSIKDTGVGIPDDVKNKLFTPMFTTKSKGQGFGLAVVKRMTEGLGGTISFESQVDKGTTFTVRLPPPKELNGKWSFKY